MCLKNTLYKELYFFCEVAEKNDEIPISCMVILPNGERKTFINNKERNNCVVDHAEIRAIKWACKRKRDFRLNDVDLIISTEPCVMCLGAILESRINKITILSKKEDFDLFSIENYIKTKKTIISYDIQPEFTKMVKKFFIKKRMCYNK